MIAALRGQLLLISPQLVIIDAGGVGYGVRTPLSTYWELEKLGEGAAAALLIYTHVREDAIELFGFLTADEKSLFEKLIAISGIGPRLAQSILSGMPPREVVAALAAGDVARLVKIPGVGKKTAERMVLELRDAARLWAPPSIVATDQAETANLEDEVTAALVTLGYRPNEVQRVAHEVRTANEDAPFAELLRLTLRRLSRV